MSRSSDSTTADVRRTRGASLKQARNGSGLSARKLVERVNARTAGSDLTEHAIYAYESGRVLLSREVAERVAEVLRVPLGGLLAGDPDFPEVDRDEASGARGGSREGCSDRHDGVPAGSGEGPPEAGRWAATRSSLLARCEEAEPAAAVLVRQLSARRFQLPDPVIFAASFELLDADLAALAGSPEAAWLGCREDDAWHEPLRDLLRTANAVREASASAWAALRSAPAGRAAEACPAAASALEAALGDFRDARGRLRRLHAVAE